MQPKVIGIIGGKGNMGKYFADFFERNGYKVIVSDRGTKLKNKDIAKKADVVLVSVPINVTEKVIQEIAPLMTRKQCLMDLTSIKGPAMDAMKKSKAHVIGLHPIFGPTNPIEGQTLVLCSARAGGYKKWMRKLLKDNKVHVREMSAKKHDELMAYVQVLAHFANVSLADALRKSKISLDDFLAVQSPIYRFEILMAGRILAQDPALYANIQMSNPRAKKVLHDFIDSAKDLAGTVEEKSLQRFEKFFKDASSYFGRFKKVALQESTGLIDFIHARNTREDEEVQNLKKCNIAVLGPKNTYSDMAVKNYKPEGTVYYASTIAEVFELVAKGKIKEGLVPLENTTSGSVRETLDELYEKNVYIERVMPQSISLALVAKEDLGMKDIKRVYSHAQPLMQVRNYLKKNLSKAIKVTTNSTAAALDKLMRTKHLGAAAVASVQAAKKRGFKVLQAGIEDDKKNTTHFAVIKKGKPKFEKDAKKTSIALHFGEDKPGQLISILQELSDRDINLTKIESRPNPYRPGEYVIYLDFVLPVTDKKVQAVLKAIKKKVAKLKILGSYPVK